MTQTKTINDLTVPILRGQATTRSDFRPYMKCYNSSGGTITAGSLVYISGWNETNTAYTITKADADAGGAHAQYILESDLTNNTAGAMAKSTRLTGQNVGGAVGDPVYLSTTAGGWTLTKPTASNAIAQVVGYVAVVDAAVGVIEFILNDTKRVAFGSNELQSGAAGAAGVGAGTITEANQVSAVASALQVKRIAKAKYVFGTDGGAVSAITPAANFILPAAAIITNAWHRVTTALTSGGSATVAFSIEAANDVVTAVAYNDASMAATGTKCHQGIPVASDVTKFITTTTTRSLVLTVGTAALTAGVIEFYVEYVVGG